jgi:hypothetical protein
MVKLAASSHVESLLRPRGRPPVTPDVLSARVAAYCKRYAVTANDGGLPPFPAGKRETEQHREWMTLYKAHQRLSQRGPSTADVERRHELLAHQHGRCLVCRKPLDLDDSRLDQPKANGNPQSPEPAVLHARCLELVNLARSLGGDALDHVKARL